MRLDKYLAHAGIGSRKQVKQWIRKQHVTVNGEICKKDDTHINEYEDVVCVDGEELYYEPLVYIMLYKPQGVISATQDEEHETVLDGIDVVLPKGCFPVGRLDMDTEGLLLITNDGKLSHRLLSPKHHVAKTYVADIAHPLSEADIALLEGGTIVLDDKPLLPAQVKVLSETTVEITIQEGRYHQIKRMLQAVGNEVCFLKRYTMGPLVLDDTLQPGEWRFLSEGELAALQAL